MKYHVVRRTCRTLFPPPLLLWGMLSLLLLCPCFAWADDATAASSPLSPYTEEATWTMLADVNEVLLPTGDLLQARQVVQLVQATPLSPSAEAYSHYLCALASTYEGDAVTALAEYQAMQASSDGIALLLGGMEGEITTLMVAGDYAQAMAAATALIEVVDPTTAPQAEEYRAGACYQMGEMLYRQGKYPEALRQFRVLLTEYAQTSWQKAAQAKVDELTTALPGGTR